MTPRKPSFSEDKYNHQEILQYDDIPLPHWTKQYFSSENNMTGHDDNDNNQKNKTRLEVHEWDKDDYDAFHYREKGGWMGTDFIHSRSSAVRILTYFADFGGCHSNITLEGIVYFSPAAESHAGYCHGGSMCAIFDDVIGWCGFIATGKCLPWSGFTAQINTSLKRPVKVGSVLLIRAKIKKRQGRKVWIDCALVDPSPATVDGVVVDSGEEVVHACGDGLFIMKKDVE